MVKSIALSQSRLVLERTDQVLLHRDYVSIRERQVTVLSGGGSGHEPTHAGYIGEGMLTGVVCGGVCRISPSTQQVLTAIRLATGPHGCLVVVKNETSHRINFGLAVEQAKAEGLECEMVVVGEDMSVLDAKEGCLGLSGIVFVHKLAGAAAKAGKDLRSLVIMVTGLMKERKFGTFSVAIDPCALPGQKDTYSEWRNDEEAELGTQGELGLVKCDQQDVPSLCKMLVDKMVKAETSMGLALEDGSKCVLMVNNLGSTTCIELDVVAKHTVEALRAKGVEPERVIAASFMTPLEMTGLSLSVWNSNGDTEMLVLFDAPTSAPAWTHSPFDLSQ